MTEQPATGGLFVSNRVCKQTIRLNKSISMKEIFGLSDEDLRFIEKHEQDDIRDLALRKSLFEGRDASFLLSQIAGRKMAKNKIPSWYANPQIVYPQHLSMEQASSETTASYKASLLSGSQGRLIDLTGGLGVDFVAMLPNFDEGVYVESSEELCRIAAYNFGVLGIENATIENTSAEDYLSRNPQADLIYIDPSRRDTNGRKIFRIQDCQPNVSELIPMLTSASPRILLKYSPMLDIGLAVQSLANVSEVHVVAVDNECRELLFVLEITPTKTPSRYVAVNLKKNGQSEIFSFSSQEKMSPTNYAQALGSYLYEPNAAILKVGGFDIVASRYDVLKLHPNTHLYTCDELKNDFPGRIFEVEDVFSPNKHHLRNFVSNNPQANISVRNYPDSVAEIRKKTGIKEGGNRYVFATTLNDGQKKWIVCSKIGYK